jgi:hypothetical protein
MDGIFVIGGVVDRRYLENQPNPTDEFDLSTSRGVHGWSDMHVVARETPVAITMTSLRRA